MLVALFAVNILIYKLFYKMFKSERSLSLPIDIKHKIIEHELLACKIRTIQIQLGSVCG